MKTKQLAIIIISFLLTSCSQTVYYYQLYKTQPTLRTEATNFDPEKMVYSDGYCEIRYDLWSEGGTSGFVFTNKTDSIICIDLTKSFYVLNGVAYDYFRNRSFSTSVSSGSGVTASSSNSATITGITTSGYLGQLGVSRSVSSTGVAGKSVSQTTIEKNEICVPPKTSKVVSEYSVFEAPIRYCNLSKFPNKGQSDKVRFAEDDSPLSFGNFITYNVEGIKDSKTVSNEFYVTQIENYPESGFIAKKEVINCDPNDKKRKHHQVRYFQHYSLASFYNRYTVSTRFDSTRVEVFDFKEK